MTANTGAVIFGCLGTALRPDEAAFFRDSNPFGFSLFARNVEDPAQLRRLTAELRDCVGRDAPVFVDQEGGRVQRLRAPHWTEWLPPLDMVKLAIAGADPGQGAAVANRAMWLRYRIIASELRGVGIDGNYAPCLDVANEGTHPFLLNRCYSNDPGVVTDLGRAAANGHLAGGVLPVIKHMPGHGRGNMDSHQDLPVVTTPRAMLDNHDFAPFRALSDLPLAMTAHVVYTSIDPDRPATTSPRAIKMMREDIGFSGLLLSDDLSMNALWGTVGERTVDTMAAGVDIALHCNGEMAEMREVANAAGQMSDAAQKRATLALAMRKTPETVDIAALQSELSGLLDGQGNV